MLTLTVFMALLEGVVFARDFQHFDFEKINLKEQMVFNGKPLHYIKVRASYDRGTRKYSVTCGLCIERTDRAEPLYHLYYSILLYLQ